MSRRGLVEFLYLGNGKIGADGIFQNGQQSEHRVGGKSVLGRERTDPVKRPVDDAVAVNNEEFFHMNKNSRGNPF